MDDLLFMRRGHGPSDLPEDLQAFPYSQFTGIAKLEKRQTVDVLHYEVREAIVGGTPTKEIPYIRMIERGEDLAFAAEPAEDHVGVHPTFYKLYGDCLVEFPVDSCGPIYGTHTAPSDLFIEPVGADIAADQFIFGTRVRSVHLPW